MKTILEQDNPTLREKSEPVTHEEFGSIWLRNLVDDLFCIMKEMGAVGVAAPQIGINKAVIVFGTAYTKSRKIVSPIPNMVLINPSFKILSEAVQIGYEGCLKFGELRGEVSRALEIEYTGFDLDGNLIKKQVSGIEAHMIQHEVDHLNGILFIDHVKDKNTLITATELQRRSETS